MVDSQGDREHSHLALPIRTTFAWRPSVYPSSDLHIWASSYKDSLSFDSTTRRAHDAPIPSPDVLVLLIPGNPGLVNFYDRYLDRLFENLSSKDITSQIICVGHVGHSFRIPNADTRYFDNFRIFSGQKRYAKLQDQIEYHQDFVKHLSGRFDFKKTKLILIGHSVGAYIATKVMEKHPNSVFHMFGLFPTLSNIGDTPNGRNMAPLFWPITLAVLHVIQLALSLVMPKALLMLAVTLVTAITRPSPDKATLSPHNIEKAAELVSNANTVAGALIMARSEMKEILDLDPKFFQTFKNRISLYWTKEEADTWVNEVEVRKIVDLLGSSSTSDKNLDGETRRSKKIHSSDRSASNRAGLETGQRWERSTENIPHAFCLEHNEIMADKTARWIQCLLKD